jgi:hypothetical protein
VAYWRLAVRYGTPVDLPPALGDFDRPRLPVGGFVTTAGGAELSQVTGWRRVWPLNFGVITDAAAAELAKWIDGTYGRGPFDLWEGAAVKAVPVNVAAFDAHYLYLGQQTMLMTLREVLLP